MIVTSDTGPLRYLAVPYNLDPQTANPDGFIAKRVNLNAPQKLGHVSQA